MCNKKAFTLVELLVVIAIIAVLLAILLPSLRTVKAMAQRLQCQTRLKAIGTAIAPYADTYNGLMPRMTGQGGTFMRGHWNVKTMDTTTGYQEWQALGCFYAAEYVQDGRLFYCPATEGWLEEYKSYCDPGPWGTLPQKRNQGAENEWVRINKGYTYWPLKRKNSTQAEYDAVRTQPGGAEGFATSNRYEVGLPLAPVKYSDLGMGRAIAYDHTLHMVKGSGWNLNVAFGDSHVALAKTPKDAATDRYIYPYQGDDGIPAEEKTPSGGVSAKWTMVGNTRYTWLLQM